MIRIVTAPEPREFNELVREPGKRAILEMTGQPAPLRRGRKRKITATSVNNIKPSHLPDYWTKILPQLAQMYGSVCVYYGIKLRDAISTGTVDHFLPKSTHGDQAYEWSNYRFASLKANIRKGDTQGIIDPFEITGDWFQIELAGFQVIASKDPEIAQDANLYNRINFTIDLLQLNEQSQINMRSELYTLYKNKDISEAVLKQWYPVFAYELMRQGLL